MILNHSDFITSSILQSIWRLVKGSSVWNRWEMQIFVILVNFYPLFSRFGRFGEIKSPKIILNHSE